MKMKTYGFAFSPMWAIWAETFAVPRKEAMDAWKEYIDAVH